MSDARPGGSRRDRPRVPWQALAFPIALALAIVALVQHLLRSGLASKAGFLGPGNLLADVTLVLALLCVAGLTFGFVLARRGHIGAHHINQSVWVLGVVAAVYVAMLPSLADVWPGKLADFADARFWVTWLHAAIGSLTLLSAVHIVSAMNGWLPKKLQLQSWKMQMRMTFAGFWIAALLGIATYYVYYAA